MVMMKHALRQEYNKHDMHRQNMEEHLLLSACLFSRLWGVVALLLLELLQLQANTYLSFSSMTRLGGKLAPWCVQVKSDL